jgi:hypothetical protein
LHKLWASRPIPDDQLLTNLGLYIRGSALAKIFFLQEIHLQILDIPGCIMAFGTWWGQDLIVFENLRAIYEPYNCGRRIIGFDTFTGYLPSSDKDKPSEVVAEGNYSTTENYEEYLSELIAYHESENAMAHIPKHRVIRGDVCVSAPQYFVENPETLVALAYFDFAVYEPTKAALQAVLPRLVKGSILAFDELNSADYPGESRAVLEALDLKNHTVKRSKILPDRAYIQLT